MATGKSIRIYLPSGSINGIKHAEIVNWTGQAISCPRSQFKELKNWSEATKPGIYFLFGADGDDGDLAAYIGEAENVLDRLKNHMINKDFWNEVIFFTSKDENLTKSHVKYLESIVIGKATEIGRYELQNNIYPNSPTLPIADRDAMTEFSEHVRTLLGALGHKLLEPYTAVTADNINGQDIGSLQLLNKKAYGSRVSDGFLIYPDSEMSLTQSNAQSKGAKALFELLIKNKTVVLKGEYYAFAEHYLFSSPSYAASLLNGYPTNGLDAWKNDKGQSLKELEAI